MSPEGVVIIGVEIALLALLFYMWRSSKRAADDAREEAAREEAAQKRAEEASAAEDVLIDRSN